MTGIGETTDGRRHRKRTKDRPKDNKASRRGKKRDARKREALKKEGERNRKGDVRRD